MFQVVTRYKRVIQIVIVVLIVPPFAFFGLEFYTRSITGGDEVATVAGSAITQRELAEELRRQQERLRTALGGALDAALFEGAEMREAVLENLVAQRLLASEAVRARLVVGNDALREALVAIPGFQRDGRFDPELYRRLVQAQGMSEAQFEARLRHDLSVGQLVRGIAETAIVSRALAERARALEGQRREIAEALVPAARFSAGLKVEEAEARAHYEANRERYRMPERVRAHYVVLSAAELGRREPPSEEEVRQAYEARKAQWVVPEHRRASHILVRTREEAARIAAEARRAPARFAALARAHSQDTGSAAQGGDLGFFTRGMVAQGFEEAVFDMTPGEIRGPVESEFGFHVVRLEAVRPARTRLLEEVRAELVEEIARQKGMRRFGEAAEAFQNLAYEQSESLVPAAERFGLKIEQSGWIERGGAGAPAALGHPKLLAMLFGHDALQGKRNTDAVEVAPGVLVAARVAAHEPARERPFEEVRGEIEAALVREKARALARAEGEAKLAVLARGEDVGLRWGPVRTVSVRGDATLPEQARRAIFALASAKLPAYVGADKGDEGYAIYRVLRVVASEQPDEARHESERLRAQRRAGEAQFAGWLAALRVRARVEINRSVLERK